jgi:opacity protein-like surface antigen
MKRSILGAAALALVLSASAVQAQKPMSFGIALGASKATGDGSDGVNLGYHALGTLAWAPPTLPVGIRFDAMYNTFSFDGGGSSKLNIMGLNANATWGMPMAASPISPYLIGGLGMYQAKVTNCDLCGDAQTKLGFNVGVGTKFALSGFGTFAEIRYHSIQTEGGSTKFIPISFGIMF